MVDKAKKRITKKDWDSIQQFILDEMETRKRSDARRRQSRIWKEVDRQVYMEGVSRAQRDKNAPADWRNSLELGELSRASEVISADIRRLTFPTTRSWFDPHVEVKPEEDGTIDTTLQTRMDGRQRAFMSQQHVDFGFKSRVDLSVKEALHHGSYVATVEQESMIQVTNGDSIKTISAPVWVPHSMWNSYPDPSIGGNNTFYQGSMITVTYKPAYQVKRMKSPDQNYPYFNLNKIKKRTNQKVGAEQTDDVELVTYRGDLVIPRSGSDILLLNSKATLANGTIIHYMPNPFPYPPVIYNGWERLDVRDPYYVSPLVKFSVTQKLGTLMANRLADAIDLKTEPPVMYDSNDPDFVMNGGPVIAPGAKTPTKGSGNYQVLSDIGDPQAALAGVQFFISQIEAGTKVDRVRSGVSPGTEQTATEVIKQSQNAELSTIDFVDKHEAHGLRPALYIQDFLNRNNVESYKFYNQELDAPDFETMVRSELPGSVHYDIVGSKGLLGEEQRQAQTSQVTAFWMGANPKLLKQPEIAKEMYRDAGNKNPEKFLNIGDEAEAFQQQIQAIVQQAQQQIQALQQELAEFTFQDEEHSLEIEQKNLEKEQLQTKIDVLQGVIKLGNEADRATAQIERAENGAD